MKIDFRQALQNLDGTPLEITTAACPVCQRPREVRLATLRGLCSDALVQGYPDPRTGGAVEIPGDEAAKRYALAVRIVNEDVLDLNPEELALIRELLLKRYAAPLFSAQARAMLNPKQREKEESGTET